MKLDRPGLVADGALCAAMAIDVLMNNNDAMNQRAVTGFIPSEGDGLRV